MAFKRAGVSAATVLAALILVGAAAAGNGNGGANGNGNAKGADHGATVDAQAQAPGNSGAAPGQVKKDATPAPQSAPAATTAAPAAAPTTPTDAGVKPSSTTAKNTSCVTGVGSTCASAGNSRPDASKRYGNGTTAAQISTSRGGNNVTLKGPGNSQPHKVVACGHRHAVDVHAVKPYNASACGDAPNPSPNPTPNPTPAPHPRDVPTPTGDPRNPSSTPAEHGTIVVRHVDWPVRNLGDPARHTHTRSSKPASQVLGEVAAAIPVVHGTLPFTGFPLWAVVLVAFGLIVTGVALRAPGAPTPAHARPRIRRRGSETT